MLSYITVAQSLKQGNTHCHHPELIYNPYLNFASFPVYILSVAHRLTQDSHCTKLLCFPSYVPTGVVAQSLFFTTL